MAGMCQLILLLVAFFCSAGAIVITPQGKCNFQWKYPIKLPTVYVEVGTTCSWKWADFNGHCVTGTGTSPANFNSFTQFAPFTYTYKFQKVGKYPYDCCLHLGSMTGEVIVVAKGATKPPVPGKCVPNCGGRCWGKSNCGTICPYPKFPSNNVASCTRCCTLYQRFNKKGISACYHPCRSSRK